VTDQRGWILGKKETKKALRMVRLKALEVTFPFKEYPERLNVIWSFRKTSTNETPADSELKAMKRFEDRICKRIEKSGQSLLAIVFTEPGYREFVFYCQDVESFVDVLNTMPQERAAYPIEIHHARDSRGTFYKSYAKTLLKP
jgi:hypothetical protein